MKIKSIEIYNIDKKYIVGENNVIKILDDTQISSAFSMYCVFFKDESIIMISNCPVIVTFYGKK
jgi:hypothetical protein